MEAMRWGVARGTFSNEAGLGSSPIAHAAARTDEPIREGLVAMLEPFIDTLCICTLTALAIISTGVWQERLEQQIPLSNVTFYERPVTTVAQAQEETNQFDGVVRVVRGNIYGTVFFFEGRSSVESTRINDGQGERWSGVLHVEGGRVSRALVTTETGNQTATAEELASLRLGCRTLANGPVLTAAAFGRALPGGQILVTIAIILFAFSTAISWSYYGDRCIGFLIGLKAVQPYRLVFVVAHFLGAIFTVRVVWAAADVANALMALPNLISLWALAGLVAVMRKKYFPKRKS